MKFTKKERFLVLIVWTAFLSLVYWGFGNTSLTMFITYSYSGLCLVFSVLYVLVSGGLRPVFTDSETKEKRKRTAESPKRANLHPVKRKDRYRRFRMKKEEVKKDEKAPSPLPPNIFKIPEEKRAFVSQVLLVLTAPFYLIFLLDWILLYIFA